MLRKDNLCICGHTWLFTGRGMKLDLCMQVNFKWIRDLDLRPATLM